MDDVKTSAPPNPFTIPPNTWGDKKTKLKNKFSQLNDDDLQFVDGKESELTARLQSKLGKSQEEVQKLISEI
jgi:uncharacterized protein YjbJ (UPF0337 family)